MPEYRMFLMFVEMKMNIWYWEHLRKLHLKKLDSKVDMKLDLKSIEPSPLMFC